MAKEILCAFGVDIDAVAGWLGSYGGEDLPSDIQRGVFAGEVGTPRLLKLFDKFKIKASWFIPGHSIETFPEQTKMIAVAGHEIGAHGYSHENPVAMTRQQEEDVLKKSVELIESTPVRQRPEAQDGASRPSQRSARRGPITSPIQRRSPLFAQIWCPVVITVPVAPVSNCAAYSFGQPDHVRSS